MNVRIFQVSTRCNILKFLSHILYLFVSFNTNEYKVKRLPLQLFLFKINFEDVKVHFKPMNWNLIPFKVAQV